MSNNNNNHTYKNRYLIYTLGPTGSGKTKLQKYALNEVEKMENIEEIHEEDKYEMSIDNIVQKDEQYVDKVKNFLIKHCIIKKCKNNEYIKCKNDEEIINIIKKNIKELESDIYFYSRKKEGCKKYEKEIREFIKLPIKFTMKCDVVVDYESVKNVLNNKPIFIYESTGKNIDSWILDYNKQAFKKQYEINHNIIIMVEKIIKNVIEKLSSNNNNNKSFSSNNNNKSLSSGGNNLKVIIAFSVVHYKTLYERNNKRGLEALNKFVEDLNGKENKSNKNSKDIVAPRIPNVYNSLDSDLCKTYKLYLELLKNICCKLENYEIEKKIKPNQKVNRVIFHFNENLEKGVEHKENEDYFIIDLDNNNTNDTKDKINKVKCKLSEFLKKYEDLEKERKKKPFCKDGLRQCNEEKQICYNIN